MMGRDRSHVGQTEETFTQHYKIVKAFTYNDGKPWLLYLHFSISKWKLLGRCETHAEAIDVMDTMCRLSSGGYQR